ncbi:MAG: dipeptidase [Ignavibacteriales bacterium]|nr:dipeptidase [Ignavibacteriales bacterium]
MKSLLALLLSFVFCTLVFADNITVSGVVKDVKTGSVLDSSIVTVVSTQNSADRYSVTTGATGTWSLNFTTSGIERESAIPASFELRQNYPNPFNPSTRIGFTLQKTGTIRIAVYTILGQELDARTLTLDAGDHEIEWRSMGAAGALFYAIEMDGARQVRKMIQLDGGSGGGLGSVVTARRVISSSSLAKTSGTEYFLIISKFAYMPDTSRVVLTNGLYMNSTIETVHSRAFVIDLHNDMLEQMIGGYQIGIRNPLNGDNQTDLPRLKDGGVDAQMVSIWTDGDTASHTHYAECMVLADTFQAQVNRYSTQVALARSSGEIAAVNASGRLAAVYGLEGGHAIENSLAKLQAFYALGVRYMTLTWNNSSNWAISAADTRSATQGLTDFGKQVIRSMDSLGIIVDISHVGIKTIQDVLTITKNPIIASHSGVRSINNNTRNLYDDQIRAIAASGGVIGVVFYRSFLSSTGKATIDTVIRHMDYIRNLVGIDYIALGSDFSGGITTPTGLEDVSKFPALTYALLRHGYSIADVQKVLGENYLRVFKKVCK